MKDANIMKKEVQLAKEKMDETISFLRSASDAVREYSTVEVGRGDKKLAYKADCVAGELYHAMQEVQRARRELDGIV